MSPLLMVRLQPIPGILVLLLVSTTLAGCLGAEGGLQPAGPSDGEDTVSSADDPTPPDGSTSDDASPGGSNDNGGNETNGNETGGGSNGNGNETDGNETDGNETDNGTTERPMHYGKIHGHDLPTGGIDEEYVLNLSPMRWSETTLTVLIVPPAYHPTGDGPTGIHQSRFLRAVEDSIVHWKEAIDQYGSDDLSGNIEFDVYVAGRDDLSPTQLGTVDIYIGNPPGGVGLQGLAAYPLNPRCVIANLGLPGTAYETIFMISAHEFGHCLGMSHPGEEVDGATEHDPWFDLMAYSWVNQPNSAPDLALDCISNLNLMAVHEAFAPAFDRQAASQVSIPASDYFLTDCADRFLDAL